MSIYSYLNGISIAIYFAVCLLCGLQLVKHIFGYYRLSNSIVSRVLGSVLLTWACGALLYMTSALTEINGFAMVGCLIDVAAFAGLGCMAYVLYANQWPKLRTTLILSLPYGLIILFVVVYPHLFNEAFILVMACLLAQYLFYFRALHRREQLLDDLYADPERHSLKWLITFACMYAIYWAVRLCFVYTSLSPWSEVALYICMSILILFIFNKVCTYGESVSLETQQQIENANVNNLQPATCNLQPAIVDRLNSLMTSEQMYLQADLTIEEVALRLNTQPKYLSAVLSNEMHTSFTKFINHYRIEHAKVLLQTTDDKVEYIGVLCGYNSRQVFIRAFTTLTGKTPSEWRK